MVVGNIAVRFCFGVPNRRNKVKRKTPWIENAVLNEKGVWSRRENYFQFENGSGQDYRFRHLHRTGPDIPCSRPRKISAKRQPTMQNQRRTTCHGKRNSTVAPDYVPGKVFKAMDYFDLAIEGARENEYLNEEALAYEVAGRFYLDWGKKIIAQRYLTNAL